MDIRGLGYIGVNVADTAAWRTYAEILGTMVVSSSNNGSFHIKIDDRPYRVVVRTPMPLRAWRSLVGSFGTQPG
jgi:hypothetical protein